MGGLPGGINEAPAAECRGIQHIWWSILPTKEKPHRPLAASRGAQKAHKGRHQQSSVTHLLGRAWGMEGARAMLPGDGEGGKLSEMMWVGGFPNTQAGPHPGASGGRRVLRRSWGILASPWPVRTTPLKRCPCRQHQEAHKAVYFRTYDTGWMRGQKMTTLELHANLASCALPGVLCFLTIVTDL